MLKYDFGSMTKTDESDGIIFDIQRYSVHDGPGIRTLVFLKGCPLICPWCCNPESQKGSPEIMWTERNCIHCNKCLSLCPLGAIKETEDGQKKIDKALCNGCGVCAENCYADAMQLAGRYVTVRQVIEEVEKDKEFYAQSGGGLTLGGGEPLAQHIFAKGLLQEAKQRGIITVVETAGYVPWETFAATIDLVDLFLYDIKVMDSRKHEEYTGISNELILENARKLSKAGAKMVVRVPLVPGFNDADGNIRLTSDFAREVGASGMELLPYHHLGLSKYRKLDRSYALTGVTPPAEESVQKLRALIAGYF